MLDAVMEYYELEDADEARYMIRYELDSYELDNIYTNYCYRHGIEI